MKLRRSTQPAAPASSAAPTGDGDGTWIPVLVAAAMALVAALVPYHRGLRFPFALDDYTYLFQAAGIDPAAGLRRWLAVRGYYELGLRLFGTESTLGWHIVAFALHAANATWVYVLARRLGAGRLAAWTACGLFAASPLAFTVLYWVACIQELGACFFVLASVHAALGARTALALVTFGLAMLCKESVLAAPLVLPLVLGRRGLRLAAAQLALGAAIFFGSGLHQRMFDANPGSPYATSYGSNLLVHFATQLVWFLALWRAYPDRVAGPDGDMLLPAAAAIAGAVLVATRAGAARQLGIASAWFVALLLPVLPLVAHAYAYYAYVPQIGLLMLAGAALAAAARRARLPVWGRSIPAAAAVLISMVFAARNARTHETLLLPGSNIPHDSVLRYGRLAGALVRQVRAAELPVHVRRVVITGLPIELGKSAQTPTQLQPGPGVVRERTNPVEVVLRQGRLIRLHFPGREGGFQAAIGPRDEAADTALFLASGFSNLEHLQSAAEAYCVQAQGKILLGDPQGGREDLRRALASMPEHVVARILLAALELEAGDRDQASRLVQGIDAGALPAPLRARLEALRGALGTAP